MMDDVTSYRALVYDRYASILQAESRQFDAEVAARWGKAYNHYLRDWLPLDRDAPILDIGCGNGKLLHFLIQRGYTRVSGMDISPEQVYTARQVTPNVTQGDVLQLLESCRDSYSLICGLDIIEHFHKNELVRLLQMVRDALVPGGRLILQTPNADTPWGTYHRYNDFTHEICFYAGSLSRLLRLYEFYDIESREQGPVPLGYSVSSTIRYGMWLAIRQLLKLYNLIETGSVGTGIYTRVFLTSARRR